MGYICLKPMKVALTDGSGRTELRRPGDAVPEASTWANPALYIRRGWISATDGDTMRASGYHRDKLKPMVVADAAAKARAQAPVPQTGEQLPGYKGPESEEKSTDSDQDEAIAEMMELSRSDLDALAEEHGVDDSDKMPNKRAVAEAIVAAGD